MVVVVASSRSPADAVVLLLCLAALLLLAFTVTGTNSTTICDTAECGKGSCSEVPGFFPVVTDTYKCNCDPGWSQPKLLNFSIVSLAPFLPCVIPDCLFDSSCYNFSLFTFTGTISITDPCVFIDCGLGGVCKKGEGFSYSCECLPGYFNFLSLPALPCVNNCSFGADCSKLGIGPPPPAPSPSTAPPPTRSVSSSWRLLQKLLSLAILLRLLQVVQLRVRSEHTGVMSFLCYSI